MNSWSLVDEYDFDIQIGEEKFNVSGHVVRDYPDYVSPPMIADISKVNSDESLSSLTEEQKRVMMIDFGGLIAKAFEAEMDKVNEIRYQATMERYYEG